MQTNTRKKAIRESKAIHLYFAKGWTVPDIAEELDVSESTAYRYVNSEPADEVKELLAEKEAQVRVNSLEHLREQFADVTDAKEEATTVSKVFDQGDGTVETVETEDGRIVPVVQDYEIKPDGKVQQSLRREEREIMQHMERLVGAAEPQEVEVSGGGIVIDMGDESDTAD
jgi:predicted transcriptional regulator